MSGFCSAPDVNITTTFTPIVAPDATDAIVRPLHRLRWGGLAQPAKSHLLVPFFIVTACATRKTGLSNYCILLAECRRLSVRMNDDIRGHSLTINQYLEAKCYSVFTFSLLNFLFNQMN